MPEHVILAGVEDGDLLEALDRVLNDAPSRVVGIASAFVSVAGVEAAKTLLKDAGMADCRLVAGTDYAITHPEALKLAKEAGWAVRIGKSRKGVFHPKLIVAGRSFGAEGVIQHPTSIYIGSGNLTAGGLQTNIECGVVANASPYAEEAAEAFGTIWLDGDLLTAKALRHYAAVFAKTNRQRSVQEMRALGVIDDGARRIPPIPTLRKTKPPKLAVVNEDFAAYVWAELRSFTGQYAFQVEFPRAAGEVLGRFVRGRVSADNKVDVECEDGHVRKMTSRYYDDNSMYRLNIPPAVPNVDWAKANKQGIALVQRGSEGGVPLSLRILLPGNEMDEIVGRSVALGTWGRTSTRLYGWC